MEVEQNIISEHSELQLLKTKCVATIKKITPVTISNLRSCGWQDCERLYALIRLCATSRLAFKMSSITINTQKQELTEVLHNYN